MVAVERQHLFEAARPNEHELVLGEPEVPRGDPDQPCSHDARRRHDAPLGEIGGERSGRPGVCARNLRQAGGDREKDDQDDAPNHLRSLSA